jgi:hypothetical protein
MSANEGLKDGGINTSGGSDARRAGVEYGDDETDTKCHSHSTSRLLKKPSTGARSFETLALLAPLSTPC